MAYSLKKAICTRIRHITEGAAAGYSSCEFLVGQDEVIEVVGLTTDAKVYEEKGHVQIALGYDEQKARPYIFDTKKWKDDPLKFRLIPLHTMEKALRDNGIKV